MNIFDILGPVMVGPSSSHTAGVVRMGRAVRGLLGETPVKASVGFHGSFATTYKGHGSDKAMAAGLMGFSADDPRIRDSLTEAQRAGYRYTFAPVELAGAHPNTVRIEAETAGGASLEALAESLGGGRILVTRLDGLEVSFDGAYDTMVVVHKDMPGVIASVTHELARHVLNVAGMKVYRSAKGGDAMMFIETDGKVPHGVLDAVRNQPHVKSLRYIAKIEG